MCCKKIIPLLAGWSIKDALDALEYTREHICESTNVRQVTDPSQAAKVDEEIMSSIVCISISKKSEK